jgi:hypothetical protein
VLPFKNFEGRTINLEQVSLTLFSSASPEIAWILMHTETYIHPISTHTHAHIFETIQ